MGRPKEGGGGHVPATTRSASRQLRVEEGRKQGFRGVWCKAEYVQKRSLSTHRDSLAHSEHLQLDTVSLAHRWTARARRNTLMSNLLRSESKDTPNHASSGPSTT